MVVIKMGVMAKIKRWLTFHICNPSTQWQELFEALGSIGSPQSIESSHVSEKAGLELMPDWPTVRPCIKTQKNKEELGRKNNSVRKCSSQA